MDEKTNIPVDNTDEPVNNTSSLDNAQPEAPAAEARPTSPTNNNAPAEGADDRMGERLERLGGEPAPVITPEEFARLQRAGQVHIDARGRVKTARPSDMEEGVSLRKRRAWYDR